MSKSVDIINGWLVNDTLYRVVKGFIRIHYLAENPAVVICYCSKIKSIIRYETKKMFVICD